MLAELAIAVLVALVAWFGWKKNIGAGLLAAVLLPVSMSLVAAFTISVPADVGGPWVFVVSLAVLEAVALASLAVTRCIRRSMSRD